MVFGWATLMLFGRVPQSKQLLLAGVSAGALLWIVLLVGVAVPDFGAWLIAFVPAPDFIDEGWIRLAMLLLAAALPLAIGAGGLMLMDPADRPKGMGGKVIQVLRGYPYAAVLALVILLMLIVAPSFKVRSIVKGWQTAHIPIIVKPDGYEQVAGELESAVDAAGLNLEQARAPRVLEAPSRLLAVVGGESVRRLVPDRLVMLKAPSLEVMIHPSDVAMAGDKQSVARARAAIADRLTKTEAYLTVAEEAQRDRGSAAPAAQCRRHRCIGARGRSRGVDDDRRAAAQPSGAVRGVGNPLPAAAADRARLAACRPPPPASVMQAVGRAVESLVGSQRG